MNVPLVVYLNFYNAINEFDGGVRSAFFNATSTAGMVLNIRFHMTNDI